MDRSDSQAVGVDFAIPAKELLASYKKELTQPSEAWSKGQSIIPTSYGPWKADSPLSSSIRVLCDIYLFFSTYIHHLCVLLLTGMVAVLACALRGMIDEQQYKCKCTASYQT